VIVVDTGPVVALLNDRDDHHERCRDFLETQPGPLLLPATVFTEVCLLLERRRGTVAELAFLAAIRAGRFTLVEDLEPDLDRIAELVEQLRRPAAGHGGRLGHRAERAAAVARGRDARPPGFLRRPTAARTGADAAPVAGADFRSSSATRQPVPPCRFQRVAGRRRAWSSVSATVTSAAVSRSPSQELQSSRSTPSGLLVLDVDP